MSVTEEKKILNTFSRLGDKKRLPELEEGRALFRKKAVTDLPDIIEAGKAWVLMLVETGVIQEARGSQLLAALQGCDTVAIEDMINTYDPRFPKPILQLERYLTERVGPIASDMVLARTLPPPLYRMKARRALLPLIDSVYRLLDVLLKRSEEFSDAIMPGYTHLQHAQPMTFGHYLLGLYDAVWRAYLQLELAYDATNRCDMGCGALAGTSFEIDRKRLADLLGFSEILEHSNDCVAATDHAVDTVAAMTNIAIPVSRVANELDTWTCFEWSFIEVDDSLAETSSLMPQKKNACVFEEARSVLGDVSGCYNDILCRSHNTSYGDTIEVQAACERVVPTVVELTRVIHFFTDAIETLQIDRRRMLNAAQEGFSTVSELVSILYRTAGVPPRRSHAVIASVVKNVWEDGHSASSLTASMLNEMALDILGESLSLTDEQIKSALDVHRYVESHDSQGGVAPKEVCRMIHSRKSLLAEGGCRREKRNNSLQESRGVLSKAVRSFLTGSESSL